MFFYKYHLKWSWGTIIECLKKHLKSEVEVVAFVADRAICWLDDKEKEALLENPDLYAGKNYSAMVKPWKEVHWEGIQIAASHSWIGIEGLPLNPWNEDIFRSIGEVCGGLLQIAEETLN